MKSFLRGVVLFFFISSSYGAVNLSSLSKNDNEDIIIANQEVIFNASRTDLRRLVINSGGIFSCPTGSGGDLYLQLSEIVVNPGGQFICGTSAARVQRRIQINFRNVYGMNKRQFNVNGGTLKLHGQLAGSDTSILAADTSGTVLSLEENVNWSAEDRVVISSSTFATDGHEIRKISSGSGTSWTLAQGLDHTHHGDISYVLPGAHAPTSLSAGGAVAVNLSRNIILSGHPCFYTGNADGLTSSGCDQGSIGVDLIVQNNGHAQIDSVEIGFGGREGVMGRYPVHFHMLGSTSGQYIKNSSIHNSKNRCIVIHRTHNVDVINNVCFRHRGHGIFLEEGLETGNLIDGNVVINSLVARAGKDLLPSERAGTGQAGRFRSPASFWISNPNNEVVNNIAAGSDGTGFWMSFKGLIQPSGGATVYPTNIVTENGDFHNNRASSTQVGITWDGVDDKVAEKVNAAHYSPRHNNGPSGDPERPEFSNLMAFKNSEAGIYFRGDSALFKKSLMVDNKWSFFVAYSQELRFSRIVGISDQMTAEDKELIRNSSNSDRFGGIAIYDGPFEINTVRFSGFGQNDYESPVGTSRSITPYAFFNIGGHWRYTNKTQGLSFDERGAKRVYLNASATDFPSFDGIYWKDSNVNIGIKDLDGTLINWSGANSNFAGRTIVASSGATIDAYDPGTGGVSGCFPTGRIQGGKVCPVAHDTTRYQFVVLKDHSGTLKTENNAFVWFNTQMEDVIPLLEPTYGPGKFYNKVNLLNSATSGSGEYHVITPRINTSCTPHPGCTNLISFSAARYFRVEGYTDGSSVNRPAKIKITGKLNCILNTSSGVSTTEQTMKSSLSAFDSANGSAWYHSGSNLYVKLEGGVQEDRHMNASLSSIHKASFTFDCDN